MAVFFLDNDQKVIKIVPDDGAISILQTQELPESDGLLKDTLYVRLKNDQRLFDAQYMAVKSYGDNRNAFDLYRIVNEIVPDNATEFEGVQLAPYELEGAVIEDLRPQYRPLDRTMNQLLEDTDWRLGYMDDNLTTVSTNFYYMSVKDALKKIQDLLSIEFLFKVEISGNEITDKWVEVYREVGNRTLKRFNYGTNALTVKRETSSNELYTALIGRGKGEEVSSAEDNPGGQAGYGRKINFADIEWSRENGDPVDKPKGQKYIELPQATEEYGIKLIDGRKVPRVGIVEFSDTEEPEALINQTWQELQYYARPRVLFSTTVAKIGDTSIGDTVTIHRHDLNMHYMTRVRKVVRNRKNDKQTQLEIGDVVHTPSTKRQGQINSALNNVASDLENVRGEVTEARQSADGKNVNNYGNIEPDRKKVGDTWFRDHPSLTGESQILVWNGEAWELIMDTSETTKNADAIKEQQKEIDATKEAADEALSEIEVAIRNAGFTSLDETISSVQAISNQAQINAGTAIDNALEAMQQASQAVDNTGSLNIRVDEIENTLSVKADKQTVDDLTGVVDTHTTNIQANAQSLALKANQDTVDTLVGTVQSLGTEFDIVAGQVSSRVWNTDIETAIDGIEVGGRNLFIIDGRRNLGSFGSVNSAWVVDGSTISTTLNRGPGLNLTLDASAMLKKPDTGRDFTISGYIKVNGEIPSENIFTSRLTTQVNAEKSMKYNPDTGLLEVVMFDYREYIIHAHTTLVTGDLLEIEGFKVEYGNKATDWSPAPEDTTSLINHVETSLTQKYDSITATVSSIDGRVTTNTLDLDGLTTTVQSVESDLEGTTTLLNTTRTTVSGHTSTIATLRTDVDGKATTAQFNTLNSTVNGTITRVGNAEGKITQIESNINGLQTTVASKASQTQVTQLEDGITSLVSGLNSRKNHIPYWEVGGLVWADGSEVSADDRIRTPLIEKRRPGNVTHSFSEDGEPTTLGYIRYLRNGEPYDYNTEATRVTLFDTVPYVRLIKTGTTSLSRRLQMEAGGVTPFVPYASDVSQSQISQLADNINLRVSKGDVISQINIEAERTLIQSDKLLLNADNTVITGTAWMDGAVIANASIDGAKIQDATIGSAKIANLDVSKISGDHASFITAAFNSATHALNLSAAGLVSSSSLYAYRLTDTGVEYYADSNQTGVIRAYKKDAGGYSGRERGVAFVARSGYELHLGYGMSQTASPGTYSPAIAIDGTSGNIYMNNIYPRRDTSHGLKFNTGYVGDYQGWHIRHSNSNGAGIFFANNGYVYVRRANGNYLNLSTWDF